MHGYDFNEDLYQNCEIHSPWVRGSDPKAVPIWLNSKNVKHCIIFFMYFHSCVR